VTPGRRRLLAGLAAGAAAAALALTGILDTAEFKSWDWRLRAFAPGRISNQVAILAVDQTSLNWAASEQGLSWPWPRGLYVPIIEYCRAAGACAVAFDVFFTEFSSYGQGDDEELAGAVGEAKDVVLALGVHGDETGSGKVLHSPELEGDPGDLPVPFRSMTAPLDMLQDAGARLGNVDFVPDPDGIFRRMPAAFKNGGLVVLPLALETARAGGLPVRFDHGGLRVSRHRVSPDSLDRGGFPGNDRRIPLDPEGRMIVPYRGPAQTIPSYTAASAIQSFIQTQSGETPTLDPELLRDRFVFVGLTAPGLLDLRPTPMSAVYPGVEVHATVLDALLRGDTIAVAPWWAVAALCLVAAGVVTWGMARIPSAWVRATLLPLALAAIAAGGVAGYRLGWWLPMAGPGAGASLAFLSVMLLDYATEGRQRRFLKQAFRHYLSPAVVEEIVRDPSRLKLGGERKELTLSFSDLAGFSTISEGLEPESLTGLLNRYLSEMTEVIQDLGGTVDKFEGDAIIAFWNAPLDQPDHARRGVTAALRSLQRLDRINPELEKVAGRPLAMRIGLHTGVVVVGNLGSRERFDYSVIGDAANLASRLEGLGKVFRSPVIVSGETWSEAGDAVFGREIGQVRVVGRRTPCRIFQPAGFSGEPPVFAWWPGDGAAFAQALAAFYAGRMCDAEAGFAALADDPVAGAYREECARLLAAGLPESWDGVWEMQSK